MLHAHNRIVRRIEVIQSFKAILLLKIIQIYYYYSCFTSSSIGVALVYNEGCKVIGILSTDLNGFFTTKNIRIENQHFTFLRVS